MTLRITVKISWIIAATALFLSGCDGLHRSRANIYFTEYTMSNTTGVQIDSPNELLPHIEKVAEKHGMKCNRYDEVQKYFGCGVGGFNVMTYVKTENSVMIELSEFGPWWESKPYQALKTELSKMLNELYPGQGILQSIPLK